ncbi:MAG: dihydroorotate dehydrogenase (NAD+) catalytic subunit [Planctomycetota bacterium]
MKLYTSLGNLQLKNPIMSASGTFGHGLEMQHFVPPASLGAWVSKTVTLLPRHGNPAPRIRETEAGFLNSIGLENRGVEAYIEETLPSLEGIDSRVVTNVGGESPEAFVAIVERLTDFEIIDAFEVNLSCPNVDRGRLPFATDPKVAEGIISRVRKVTNKPIFAKLSPNVSRIGEMAVAVEAGGADGITAVNTMLGMQVDWRTGKPGLATLMGGYSGIGVKPVALRCAYECVQAVSIPVIGCGGISSADDVLEFLAVGCRAVQVGTASFSDPGLMKDMAQELITLLDSQGLDSVEDVIGCIDRQPVQV